MDDFFDSLTLLIWFDLFLLARPEVQTIFVHFLVQMKTLKSPFEINWPLAKMKKFSLTALTDQMAQNCKYIFWIRQKIYLRIKFLGLQACKRGKKSNNKNINFPSLLLLPK